MGTKSKKTKEKITKRTDQKNVKGNKISEISSTLPP